MLTPVAKLTCFSFSVPHLQAVDLDHRVVQPLRRLWLPQTDSTHTLLWQGVRGEVDLIQAGKCWGLGVLLVERMSRDLLFDHNSDLWPIHFAPIQELKRYDCLCSRGNCLYKDFNKCRAPPTVQIFYWQNKHGASAAWPVCPVALLSWAVWLDTVPIYDYARVAAVSHHVDDVLTAY